MNGHSDNGILDLGDPQQMVGHTGFTRGGGGGRCDGCQRIVAVLLSDHKCVRCSNAPVTGSPFGGSDGNTCERGKTCNRR